MAITKSGLFGLSLEKALIDTLGQSWEAETHKVGLISDSATPNFTTMDFWDDLSANEVTGTGWSAGGVALTTTEITLSGDVLTFDAADVSASTTTLTGAMAAVFKTTVGSSATDQLILLSDFVTAVNTSAGTFGIQWHATGIMTLSYAP
jgi:hypothetical protein